MSSTFALAALVLSATLVAASDAAAEHCDDAGRWRPIVETADASGVSQLQHALVIRERAVSTGLAARSRSESSTRVGCSGGLALGAPAGRLHGYRASYTSKEASVAGEMLRHVLAAENAAATHLGRRDARPRAPSRNRLGAARRNGRSSDDAKVINASSPLTGTGVNVPVSWVPIR